MIKIKQIFTKFNRTFPHFSDGRINYSNSDEALVLNCFVIRNNKLLLLKRSNKVAHYKGYWHIPAGYFDEDKSVRKKIFEELNEELGIKKDQIEKFLIGDLYTFKDQKINKTWHVISAKIELKTGARIKLDWEHAQYKWINPKNLPKYRVLPGLREAFYDLNS